MRLVADRTLAWSPVRRYGCAVLLFLLALGARLAIAPMQGGVAYVTFYPAVLIGFFLLGRGPGVLAAVLGGLAAQYFFLPPYLSFSLEPTGYKTLAFYALTCTIAGGIVGSLHRTTRSLSSTLRELEAHRDRLEQEVAQRTGELVKARDAAQAAALAKASFLANMSHEIRTPLNAIIGLNYLIRRGEVMPEHAQHLDKMSNASKHLLAIVSDVLDLSKMDAGRLQLESADFPLSAILDNVRSIIAESARRKGLEVEIDRDAVPHWLRGDAMRLRQALLNLAGNAVKFTRRGRIVLGAQLLREDGDRLHVRFSVQDTGLGIDAALIPRLFQPFEQADASTSRRFGGTGLGLAITQRLVRLMGGECGVDSEAGVGSTFWFEVPLARAHGATSTALDADGAAAEAQLRRDHGGARVLLAEDDEVNREVALAILQGIGLHVETARDGNEAVAMAGDGGYDLVLMDMQMPHLDGLAATRAIRATAASANVPIIALTANTFDEDRQACAEAGMDDFIAKPMNVEAIYGTLLKWLAAGRHGGPSEPPVDR